MSSSIIGALRVTLGLDSAEFTRGTKRAQKDVTAFQKSMSAGAAVIKGAFVGLIGAGVLNQFSEMSKRGLEVASSIGEQATQLGVSTRALQEYRFAATQTGIAQDEMDKALQMGTRRLGQAATGNKQIAAAYAAIGVSIRDAKGNVRDFGDLIPEIADGLNKLPSPAERAAMANQLLGKSASTLLPLFAEGSRGIAGYRAEAERLGIVLTDDVIAAADKGADELAKMNLQIEAMNAKLAGENIEGIKAYETFVANLKIQLQVAIGSVADFVSRARDWWNTMYADLEKHEGENKLLWTRIAETYASVKSRIASFATESAAYIANMVTSIRQWVTGTLGKVWDAAEAKIERVKKMFFGLYDAVVGHSYIPDMVDGIATEMARLDKVMVDPAQKATTKTAEAHRQMAADIKATLNELFPELAALAEYNDKIAKITASNLDDTAKLAAKRRLFGQYQDRLDTKDEATQTVTPDNEDEVFASAEDQIEDYLDTWQDGVRRAQKMNDAFADSFADMARDISGYFGNLVKSFKDGDFFSIVDSVLGLLSSIGQATGGFKIGPLSFPGMGGTGGTGGSAPPGFAHGGAMKLGGFGGIDRNMISLNGRPLLRASRGETLSIRPENDGGASGGLVRVMVQANDYFDARVQSQAGRVVAAAAPAAARMGANLAQHDMMRRGSRRLA
jgi:hypothetical protein